MAASQDVTRSSTVASQLTVAIVDDDFNLREALAETLQLEGYGVIACASGAALLARARYDPAPAAIVLDLVLRDMSGGRCLSALRESRWARVPVMIFSAWERPERLGLEVQGLVSKTAEPVSIIRSVERLIRSSGREMSPALWTPSATMPTSSRTAEAPRARGRRRSRVAHRSNG